MRCNSAVPSGHSTLEQCPETPAQLPKQAEVRQLPGIAAGFPSPAGDYTEEGLDINRYLVHKPAATFIFTVRGDSMRGAGILDGDKVIVDKSRAARHGSIVVAVVDGEFTLKRFYQKEGRVELHPENPAFPPLTFKEGSELVIWGVVTGLVRRIHDG
ncbi:MAG: translesion error-prone DNA polymerase V autoproteolytic subunit [Zoogloeaceae bacterium]|jgi:DNA polymerase V|nr:translesion error-prone DNA polymerase V autoproteolytic subunit [Zoogloeaceae bacterium]